MISPMDKTSILMILLLIFSLFLSAIVINRVEYLAVALVSSVMMGVVSPLIAARRLYFLAAEISHIALFAATLSIILTNITIVKNEMFWVIAIGMAMVYSVGIAIYRGIDPDIATSIVTALSVSGSVIAMYLVLTRFRTSYGLWSLILGDPLLITRKDLYILMGLAIMVMILSLSIYKVIIYVGVDRDSAILTFGNIYIYEFLFFTILGLTSLTLVRIVGYVLEHVLLLLPALITMNVIEGGKKIIFSSICFSIISSLLGFSLAVKLNLAPAGAVGFIALATYVISIAIRRLKRYG
ncbi:MAG: metal ABC transporter permease [Ignisphaera sp.]